MITFILILLQKDVHIKTSNWACCIILSLQTIVSIFWLSLQVLGNDEIKVIIIFTIVMNFSREEPQSVCRIKNVYSPAENNNNNNNSKNPKKKFANLLYFETEVTSSKVFKYFFCEEKRFFCKKKTKMAFVVVVVVVVVGGEELPPS